MLPAVCLATFTAFSTYWLVASVTKKTYTAIKRRNTKVTSTPSLDNVQVQQQQTQQKFKQGGIVSQQQIRQQQPLVSAGVNVDAEDNQQLSNKKLSNQNNKGKDYLDVNQADIASTSNLLNVAMIDDKDASKLIKEVTNDKVSQKQKKKDYDGMLEDIITQSQQRQQQQQQDAVPIIEIITVKSDDEDNDINCKESHNHTDTCKSPLLNDNETFRLSKPTQEKSELQIIQALTEPSHNKKNHYGTAKIDQHEIQMQHQHQHQNEGQDMLPQISGINSTIGMSLGQRKSSQADPVISKLIQQIDQLFLNDPASFASIINKYKVQQARYQARYNGHQGQHQHLLEQKNSQHHGSSSNNYKDDTKIRELQQKCKKLTNELQIMEIAVSEYKTVNDSKDKEIQQNKTKITKLEDKLKQLQAENNELAVNLNEIKSIKPNPAQWSPSNGNNKSLNAVQTQNQNLKQQLLQYKTQLSKSVTSVEESRGKIAQLQNKLKLNETNKTNENENVKRHVRQLQGQIKILQDNLKAKQAQLNKKEKNYEQEIKQLRLQVQKSGKKQNGPMSTRQNLPQSNTQVNDDTFTRTPVDQQLINLQKTNQNLKNQIQFAQTQIRMFQQSQSSHLAQIQALQQQLDLTKNSQVSQLKSKIFRMQPIVNQYQTMQRRYFQMKLKYEKLLHQRSGVKSKLNSSNSSVKRDGINMNTTSMNMDQSTPNYNSQIVMPTSPKVNRGAHFNVSSPSPVMYYSPGSNNYNNVNEKQGSQAGSTQNPGHYKFLFDCAFVNNQDRQFVYETLHKLLKGVLKTQKLYNSKSNRSKNPHDLIDNIRSILLIIHLQNNKILGAYTHQPFSAVNPHSSTDNIAFILDISNRKYFANQSGINSVSYNSGSLVWGFNQILLKNQENQVMYTNFCRNHNIYWDGKYKIEEFIGADKQWARISQYQIFRVSKL